MAQYFITASDYNVGDTEDTIAEIDRWTPGASVVVEQDTGGEKYFRTYRNTDPTDATGFSSWKVNHGLLLDGVVEISEKFSGPSRTSSICYGSIPDSDGYFLRNQYRGDFPQTSSRLFEVIGSFSEQSGSYTSVTNTPVRLLQRFNPATHTWEAWEWVFNDPQPSSPSISTTLNYPSYFTGDVVGQGMPGSSSGDSRKTYWIGIGTNGDPAPTGPVVTGPATPTNLGVTNLQTTSARLTWEQG